jgi:hypothetical protein
MDMKYAKYHGLGNDYLVIRPTEVDGKLKPERIGWISCLPVMNSPGPLPHGLPIKDDM